MSEQIEVTPRLIEAVLRAGAYSSRQLARGEVTGERHRHQHQASRRDRCVTEMSCHAVTHAVSHAGRHGRCHAVSHAGRHGRCHGISHAVSHTTPARPWPGQNPPVVTNPGIGTHQTRDDATTSPDWSPDA